MFRSSWATSSLYYQTGSIINWKNIWLLIIIMACYKLIAWHFLSLLLLFKAVFSKLYRTRDICKKYILQMKCSSPAGYAVGIFSHPNASVTFHLLYSMLNIINSLTCTPRISPSCHRGIFAWKKYFPESRLIEGAALKSNTLGNPRDWSLVITAFFHFRLAHKGEWGWASLSWIMIAITADTA